MLLHQLLRGFDPSINLTDVVDVALSGICEDSRQVRPGDLFIARSGAKADGRQYAADAARRGAAAIVTATWIDGCELPQVILPDPAGAASRLAHAFFDHPSRSMRVLGVTGTNGKTTTAFIIRHLLAAAGVRCGMIGTVEVDDGRERREASMTTPGAIDVARVFAAMRDNGTSACGIEVSSHALHQQRVSAVRFAAAAFTNLTQDHFDYHGGFENYAAAKAMLFEMLDPSAVAVLNARDPWSHRMLRDCKARAVWFGIGAGRADYRAEDLFINPQGSHFVLVTPRGRAQVHMQMIGQHNVANALTAAALVGETYELAPEQIASALADAGGAPGRLQPVRVGQPFGVFVDYAHTDDGLRNVLSALRPLTSGRLRVLFGCGGDRDTGKRARMARVAQELADVIYVTSDNPRTERPERIIEQIVAGFAGNGEEAPQEPVVAAPAPRPVIVESDRQKAIRRAIADAQPGDVVLLAGKGHENYQIVGTEKRHFDDVEEARLALLGSGIVAA